MSFIHKDNVLNWLMSKEGSETLRMATQARLQGIRDEMAREMSQTSPVRIMAVLHSNGRLEFYGPAWVKMFFRAMPHATVDSARMERSVEELFESRLPEYLKDIYYPHAMLRGGPGKIGEVALEQHVVDEMWVFDWAPPVGDYTAEGW